MAIVNPVAKNIKEFIAFMRPLEHIALGERYALNVISAQVAEETGYGRKVIGKNLFNIKATDDWLQAHKPVAEVITTEYVHGKPILVTAKFRDYLNYQESLADYIRLIKTLTRYAKAWENRGDPVKYFQGVAQGGFATNPIYAQNLLRAYNAICIYQLNSLQVVTEYHGPNPRTDSGAGEPANK